MLGHINLAKNLASFLEIQFMSAQELLQRITTDAAICHGKPCVRGLRYPVTLLLDLMSSGMSHDEILADFEDLERADLLAALAYAARLTDVQRVALTATP